MSDADKVRELKAEPEYGPGQPQLYDHNPEMKHVQFTDYHAHGWNFTKVFKRQVGVSPSAFRRRLRAARELSPTN